MFQSKTILPLFPTNVWAHDLAPTTRDPLNQALKTRIDELLSPRPTISPGETWQTRNDLQKDPGFEPLMAIVREAVTGVLEFLEAEPTPFEVTGCWANVNPAGAPHSMHNHGNNYLSGVYYVQTGEGSDSITFFDPRNEVGVITPRFTKRNQNNSRTVNIEAKTGRLVLFPAWLRHAVSPNQNPAHRISIAFNVMFSDFTRSVATPRWEGLE